MRRAHSATTYIARRAGVPCGPGPDEPRRELAPAPEQARRCAHYDGTPWLPPCPNVGTHRVKYAYLTRSPNGTRLSPVEGGLRFCAEHSDYQHEPVPDGCS